MDTVACAHLCRGSGRDPVVSAARPGAAAGLGEEADQLVRPVAAPRPAHAVQRRAAHHRRRQRLRHRLQTHPHPLGVLGLVLAGAGQHLLGQHAGEVRRGGPLQCYALV